MQTFLYIAVGNINDFNTINSRKNKINCISLLVDIRKSTLFRYKYMKNNNEKNFYILKYII
jgi:hypothetical protein